MCGDGVNDIAAMREATVSVAMLSGFGHESEGTIVTDAEDMRRKDRLKRRYIGSNRLKANKSKPSTLDQAGVGDSLVASLLEYKMILSVVCDSFKAKTKELLITPQHLMFAWHLLKMKSNVTET